MGSKFDQSLLEGNDKQLNLKSKLKIEFTQKGNFLTDLESNKIAHPSFKES